MKLKRTKQCKTCPWKKSVNPLTDIPFGYSIEKHYQLKNKIADPKQTYCPDNTTELYLMACHYSEVGKEDYCLGWLKNQIGPGNNIALRIAMLKYENVNDIELEGEQHECFEDTLPKNG